MFLDCLMVHGKEFPISLTMELLMGYPMGHLMELLMDNFMDHSMDKAIKLMATGMNNPLTPIIMAL